jgi:hypothetical protein
VLAGVYGYRSRDRADTIGMGVLGTGLRGINGFVGVERRHIRSEGLSKVCSCRKWLNDQRKSHCQSQTCGLDSKKEWN